MATISLCLWFDGNFTLMGRPFQALNGGPQFQFSEAVLAVSCEGPAEVDRYWAALTEGGEEGQCGWLKDRFGLSWQIVPTELGEILGDPDPGRAARATEAMLQMRKPDLAAMREAADQASA